VNRHEWRQLADRWLEDAKTLLDNNRWPAAYYLAGYAVEFGLKACVLARVGLTPEVIFEEQDFQKKVWTHSLEELVKRANLEKKRQDDANANPDLGDNWQVVKDWKADARYGDASEALAKKLYAAIADKPNGVMQWIRDHW
jgi:HEPN domain-containing protein